MELKIYFRILLRHWWIVVPVFLVTLTATIVLTFNQPYIYGSSATFVVAPSAAFQDARSFVTGLDTLSKRVEIAATYGEVASSRTIMATVESQLGLSRAQTRDISIRSNLLAGTNVLQITVEAGDPFVAREVANTVGAETIKYAQTLYELYVLRPLDEATLRKTPIRPAKQRNILFGGVLGLLLGGGLAFLAEYLRTPVETLTSVSVIDADTGVYNQSYFRQRLGTEMIRAKRQDYPLSVALLNTDRLGVLKGARSPGEKSEILRKTAIILKQYLREEDILAYFGDATFIFLFPDMTGESARAVMDRLQMRMAWTPFELETSGAKFHLASVAGVAALDHTDLEHDELLNRANRALHLAGTDDDSRTYLATKSSSNHNER